MGRKKLAHYRIVVADSAAPRDGRFVETIGYYKPLTSPARLIVDLEKADEWIAKGAEQSETVRTLLNKARKGGDDKVAIGEIDPEEAKAAKAAAVGERRKAEAKAREEAAAAAAASSRAFASVLRRSSTAAALATFASSGSISPTATLLSPPLRALFSSVRTVSDCSAPLLIHSSAFSKSTTRRAGFVRGL